MTAARELWIPSRPDAPPRHFCTDCDLSRIQDRKRCGQACQLACRFIAPDYPHL